MAIAIVNSSIVNNAANQTAHTRSVTTSAGSDFLLVSPVCYDAGGADFTSVTFNGDTCDPVTGSELLASLVRVAHYYRVAPDIATGNLVVNYDVSADVVWSGFTTWSGIDQTTPWSDVHLGNTSCTVNNVGADDVAVALYADSYVSTPTNFTPTRTQIWESNKASGPGAICGLQYEATATGSVALGMSAGTPVCFSGLRLHAATAAASATLGGTVISTSVNEADIVAGAKTIVLSLTNDTWVTAGGTFDGFRDEIIAGLDSNLAEGAGWDAVVKVGGLAVTDVVRTDNTTVTITLPAVASYDISATETITVTIPAVALTGNVALGTTPASFVISAGSGGGGGGNLVGGGLVSTGLVNGGGLVS